MATIKQTVAAIERHIGFDPPRVRSVARRLQEEGLLPLGAARVAPKLGQRHVVTLIAAVAVDQPLHRITDALVALRDATLAGADLSTAPSHLRVTAVEQLRAMAELAIEGDRNVRAGKLEFVSNWPEFALHFPDGSIQRYRPVGELASHWGATGHRKSTTISGAAFADALKELF